MYSPVCTVLIITDEGKEIEILNVDGMPFSSEFMDSLGELLWEEHKIVLPGVRMIEVINCWRG